MRERCIGRTSTRPERQDGVRPRRSLRHDGDVERPGGVGAARVLGIHPKVIGVVRSGRYAGCTQDGTGRDEERPVEALRYSVSILERAKDRVAFDAGPEVEVIPAREARSHGDTAALVDDHAVGIDQRPAGLEVHGMFAVQRGRCWPD